MKLQHKVILLALSIGLIGWIGDAIFTHLFDRDVRLLDSFFAPPSHEWPIRLLFLVIVVSFGIFTAHLIAQREKAHWEMNSLALFPLENSNPVLRIDETGMILFANDASEILLRDWGVGVGDFAPNFWKERARDSLSEGEENSVDIVVEKRTFTIVTIPILKDRYVNLYGSDITLRRAAEEALRQAHDELELRVEERTAELKAASQLLQEADKRTRATNDLLKLFMEKSSLEGYLDAVVDLLMDWSGCSKVGIRVMNSEGFIPFVAWKGFSQEFLAEESWLSIHSDNCSCLRVIRGLPQNYELNATTHAGSFNTNDFSQFIQQMTETERSYYRGACLSNGFRSLSIIPIRYHDRIMAAIHLADEQAGKLPYRVVDFVESITSVIGEAIHRFTIEEELFEASAALVDRSKMLEAFFQHSVTPLVFLDKDFNFIRVNDAYARACQREIRNFSGHNHFVDYPSDDLREQFLAVVEAKRPLRIQERPFTFPEHPEWGTSYWDLTLFPVLDGDDEVDFLVFSLVDVTGRVRDEEEIKRHRDHLEDLVNERSSELIKLNERLQSEVEVRRQAEEALLIVQADLNRAQAVAQTGSWRLNLKRNELLWSDESYRIFGIPLETPLTYETFIGTIHPEDKEFVDQKWKAALQGAPYNIEHRIVVGETVKWVRELAELEFDKNGIITGGFGTVQDITAHKQVEQALDSAMNDLRRSNEDLEQFAYVASHDLQEPLRMISSYVNLLGRRYKGKLDDDADEFIGYAVNGAIRMQRLISDLLEYSRLGKRNKPFQLFSLQEALQNALDNLKMTIRETGAEIISDPLPVIKGDSMQFVQLFQNLLDNALKFRGEEPPRIHISAQRQDNTWKVAVADNGIGVPPKHFDRIFLIFQRLHGAGKYPGTGIGLAICKKIVERHGGRIWVEPGKDKGITFCFEVAQDILA